MKIKIFTISLLAVASLVMVALFGTNSGLEKAQDDVIDLEVQEYYEDLPVNVVEKYGFSVSDLGKLSVDLETDYTTSEPKEYIIHLDATPIQVALNQGDTYSLEILEQNLNLAFNSIYNDLNVEGDYGTLGLTENSEDDVIEIIKEYDTAIVAVVAKMPAEYIYHLITLDVVSNVYENAVVSLDPVKALDDEFSIPNELLDTILPFMHITREFLGVDEIQDGSWADGIELTGKGINVAVLDSGLDWTHPDIVENVAGYYSGVDVSGGWQNSDDSWLDGWGHYDFVDEDYNPMESTPDDFKRQKENYEEEGSNPICAPLQEYFVTGHGTHVSGTIVSKGVVENAGGFDGRTVRGISPDATLYAIRSLGQCGFGTITNIMDGIEYVAGFTYQDLIDGTEGKPNAFDWDAYVAEEVARGRDINTLHKSNLVIDVINLSIGGGISTPNDPLNILTSNLTELGVVVVVAAGNSGYYGDYSVSAPGGSDRVITVGAAPTDYYVEQVEFDFAGSTFTTNVYAYPTTETIANLIDSEFDSRELVYAEEGLDGDFIGLNVTDKVVVVDRGKVSFYAKLKSALDRDAKAIIVVNYEAYGSDMVYEYLGAHSVIKAPILTIDASQGSQLKEAIKNNATSAVEVKTIFSAVDNTLYRLRNHAVAGFSSMGPNYGSFHIKPDLIAPGVNIYSTIPSFYGISAENEELAKDKSYSDMSGTSMASPHVAGVAVLMVEHYRYNEKTWDEKEISERHNELKVVMMNSSSHDIYTQGVFDPKTYEIADYSVYKTGTGLINPQRAIHMISKSRVYTKFDYEYMYRDSSKSNTIDETSVLVTPNFETGLINYGLIIGNTLNDVSAFEYDWSEKAVTIDNTSCTTGDDEYYYIEYQSNYSNISEDPSTLKYTVTSIDGGVGSTSDTTGDIDQNNFNNGSVQEYFISGSNLMYIHVPCGEKVDIVIELAEMSPNAESGFYEGFFNFNKVTIDPAGDLTLYDPYTYDYANLGSSPSMKFSHAEYGVGDDLSNSNGYKNITSSLPFAFKYAHPGAEFSFYFPLTNTRNNAFWSPLYVELFTEIEEEIRFYLYTPVYDVDGNQVYDSEGNPEVEYEGMMKSIEVPNNMFKGLSFSTGVFLNKSFYSGGICSVEPEGNANDLVLNNKTITDDCELQFATHGLYKIEAHYEYYDVVKDEIVTNIDGDNWIYVNNEGAELGFGSVENRIEGTEPEPEPYTYYEPGIHTISDDDFDENGNFWIKGWLYDEKIDIIAEYDSELVNKRHINQGFNFLPVYVNYSPFVNFVATVEDDGSFAIGISRSDLENGELNLILRPSSMQSIMDPTQTASFTFVTEDTSYYTFSRGEKYPDLNTVQTISVTGHNFQQAVEGRLPIKLNSACDVTSVVVRDELQEVLDQNNVTLELETNVFGNSSATIEWKLISEDYLGLSGSYDLFEIITTPVCEDDLVYSSKTGLVTADLRVGLKLPIYDVLGNVEWINIYENTELDDKTPFGAFIEYNKSSINVNILNYITSTHRASGYDINQNYGFSGTITGPTGIVYDAKFNVYQNLLYSMIDIIDGPYTIVLEGVGMLPVRFVIDVEHLDALGERGNPKSFTHYTGGVQGPLGDINYDGIVDTRDAYYLLLLDKSNAVNLTGSALSEYSSYKRVFESIVANYGHTSILLEDEVTQVDEVGGLNLIDIASKLGYFEFFEEEYFPASGYVKVDPTVPSNMAKDTCYNMLAQHPFFSQKEVMNAVDGAHDGDKDGHIDSCELDKIIEIYIPTRFTLDYPTMLELRFLTNAKVLYFQDNLFTYGMGDALSRNTSIETLALNNASIQEFQSYKTTGNKPNLTKVFLRDNQIYSTKASFLHYNALSIETLDMSSNALIDTIGIGNYTNIKNLYLSDNFISNLDGLETLYDLEYLDLSNNNISDLSPLAELTSLRYLILDGNQISDLSPLENLNLEVLSVKNNKISDISSLENLKLSVLNLADNEIDSIDELSKMTTLRHLYLQKNTISNINALTMLPNLIELNLEYNKINFDKGSVDSIVVNNLIKDASKGIIVNYYLQVPIIELDSELIIIEQGTELAPQKGSILFNGRTLLSREWVENIQVEGFDDVDTNTPGTYEITYKVSFDGLTSETVVQTVIVVEEDADTGAGTIIK